MDQSSGYQRRYDDRDTRRERTDRNDTYSYQPRRDEYRERRDDNSGRRDDNSGRRDDNSGRRDDHTGRRDDRRDIYQRRQDYQYQDRARERTVESKERSPTRRQNYDRNERGPRNNRDRGRPHGPSGYDNSPRDRDTYRSKKYDSYKTDSYSPADRREPAKKERKMSTEELIDMYERKLAELVDVPSLDEIKIIDSRWGIKPKGFEDVTAQRAKLSGLFPLPGHPRPVDFTKLEGLVKDRLNDSNDILNESSRNKPFDSRNSKILIISDLDFGKINYLKIVEFFNDFLKKIDIDETSINNIDSKRKTKDDKNLIIQFTNNISTTIIASLNKAKLSFNQYKEDNEPLHDESETFELQIERPHEFTVQNLTYKETKLDDIEETVLDSPRKLTVSVSPDSTETQILDQLKTIAPVKAFQLLREIGTKASLGLAFVEFHLDADTLTLLAIEKIEKYVDQVRKLEIVQNAFFSCYEPNKTTIQDCATDFKTLKELVKNEHVSAHPKLRVIQLLNIVTAKDLMNNETFQFIQKDILQEVSKLGKVQSMKIPRPANEFTPGLAQFSQPGLGRVFIEFEDENSALKAIMELAGRMYNDRTVLCAFHSYEDYKKGLF